MLGCFDTFVMENSVPCILHSQTNHDVLDTALKKRTINHDLASGIFKACEVNLFNAWRWVAVD